MHSRYALKTAGRTLTVKVVFPSSWNCKFQSNLPTLGLGFLHFFSSCYLHQNNKARGIAEVSFTYPWKVHAYMCVCVSLYKAHAASELIAGKTSVHQPSLYFCSFWLGEGGAAAQPLGKAVAEVKHQDQRCCRQVVSCSCWDWSLRDSSLPSEDRKAAAFLWSRRPCSPRESQRGRACVWFGTAEFHVLCSWLVVSTSMTAGWRHEPYLTMWLGNEVWKSLKALQRQQQQNIVSGVLTLSEVLSVIILLLSL